MSINTPEVSLTESLKTSSSNDSAISNHAANDRRGCADSSSSPSIASVEGVDRLTPELPSRRRLRASFDGAVEQLQSQRRRGKAVTKRWMGRDLGADDDAGQDTRLETQSLRYPSPASSLKLPPAETKRKQIVGGPEEQEVDLST